MKEFDLYIYTKNLEFVAIIDTFTSLRWRRQYFDTGEFELHLPYDNNAKRILAKDNIVIREDAKEVGIIENWEIEDDGKQVDVMIIGRFLTSILDRRILKERINFTGKILTGERELLQKMSPFSKLEIRNTTLDSDNITFQCTYKNINKQLIKLAKASGIAHRIIADLENKKFIYENYQGLDRTENQSENTRYEFSEDKVNIENARYTYNAKDEKNYALVGGVGEGDNRTLVEVSSGNYTDFDLKEVFVDAKDVSADNISEEEYQNNLIARGKETLEDASSTMDVSAYADDYKVYWDLGDIVNAKKESWGVTIKERITEIEETIENGNQKINVTFGSPLKEIYQNDDEE